ncbi:alpha/beta hydrolase [Chryseobacterium sp. MYb264]|uniref:alpha/beta hydrolase n=1 Tax=Chryseobacterium sp. MYb264 TaxID=2745153 RepID=UPI002E0F953A|nr:alpha/beta hydrolase [Chryseobacterium sp. MYb264]
MKYKFSLFISLIFLLINCFNQKSINNSNDVKVDTLTLVDNNRNRKIPVAYFHSKQNKKNSKQQVIIFNHGYGQNKGGDYLIYSYLTNYLASNGYFVVSIQHELPSDELLPLEGNLQVVRMPFWERGAENISFIITELKKSKPELDYAHLTLIGHSNGADMVALFADKYPQKVYKIIAMDNRRMYLPRTSKPKIYSLRSNDYPADEGVLPNEEEAKKFKMTIQTTNINHGHMDDKASEEERKTLTGCILKYLHEN